MDYLLSDLVDIELMHSLMDDFYRVTDIPVGMIGVDGAVYFEVGWRNICSQFHRTHPVASQCCRLMFQQISKQEGPACTVFSCSNHLKHAVIPIVIDGTHVASVYLGQFFFDDETVDREIFRAQAVKYGFDPQAYLAALNEVPIYSHQKVTDIMNLFSKIVMKLAGDGLKRLQQLRIEDELNKKQDKYYTLFETMAQGVVYQDVTGKIISTNPAAERILGLSITTLLNMDSANAGWDSIHIDGSPYPGEDHPAMVSLRTGLPIKDILMGVYNPQKGRYAWIIINSVPLFHENEDTPYQVCTTFTEITEIKQTQEELINARSMLQTAVEQSPAGIFILDAPGGEIHIANEAARQIIKRPHFPLSGSALTNASDPFTQLYDLDGNLYSDNDLPFAQTLLHGTTFQNIEIRVVNPDQSEAWILLNSAPIRNLAGSVIAAVVIFPDITARKKSEIMLRRYQDIVQNMQPGLYVFQLDNPTDDLSLRLVSVNPAASVHYGKNPQDMLGHRISETLRSRDPENLIQTIASVARGAPAVSLDAVTFEGPAPSTDTFSLKIFSLPECCAAVMMENVTQRVLTEKALQDSNTKYYEMVNLLPQAVFEADLDGTITFANRWAYTAFGYTIHQLDAGTNILDHVADEYQETVKGYLAKIANQGDLHGEEFIVKRKDGTSYPVLAYTNLIRSGGKITRFRGVVIDISGLKQAEEEAHKNMQRFHSLFTNSNAGVALHQFVYDDSGVPVNYRLIDANPSYEKIIGLRHEDVVGKLATDIYGTPQAPYLDQYFQVDQNGVADNFVTFFPPMGKYFDISVAPLQKGQFATIFSDITRRIQIETSLQESEARLIKAQQVAHIGSWELDLATKTMWGSPEAHRIYGFEINAEQSLPLDQIQKMVIPQDRARLDIALQNLITFGNASPYNVEFYIHHNQDGSLRAIQSIAELVYNSQNQPVKISGTIQDITDRKTIENEILHLNDELEQRVRERTSQLEIANRDLESFAYSVSHDLRAPLRSMSGFSQILLEDYAPLLDETGREYLHRINGSSQHMSQLIDDILKLSRVSRTEMKIEALNLSCLAQNILTELQTSQPDRQIQCEVMPDLYARADGSLMQIALTNLLNNSWKFTSKTEGPVITFGCELHEERLVYFVRDNGAGFDMSYIEKLFVPFQRLHHESEFEGTGIGLAIVQRIIQRHSGSIWAQSAVNQGATFYFTLSA